MKNNIKYKESLIHGSTAKGFSLVEVLFAVPIFLLIVGGITLFSRDTWVYNSFVETGLEGVSAGRVFIKTTTAEIRRASAADTGAYTIGLATATAFTFYSDIDDDGLKERVRYFLNNSLIQKGTIKPSGSPLSYNPANEIVSTLMSNVTNATIFEYYDRDYDGTTAALSSPVDIASIRLVKITATIDKDPNRPPAPMTFSTQISIRNLKDNL